MQNNGIKRTLHHQFHNLLINPLERLEIRSSLELGSLLVFFVPLEVLFEIPELRKIT